MSIYTDKSRLTTFMPAARLEKLFLENGVCNDAAIEAVCELADVHVLGHISSYYRGAHPVVVPGVSKVLASAAGLYATAYAYQRDPTYAKTYMDVSKSPWFIQAETMMKGVQAGDFALYDNASQSMPLGGRVGGSSLANGERPPELFGDDYAGDL